MIATMIMSTEREEERHEEKEKEKEEGLGFRLVEFGELVHWYTS